MKRDKKGKVVRDADFYREIGRKGGTKTKERHGSQHFAAIGKVGGDTLLAEKGRQHFRRIGKLSYEASQAAE